MSLDRDDWRALSRILSGYMEMALSADWSEEDEWREMLAAFLRDHDMPQERLEGEACLGVKAERGVHISIDQASGEVVYGRLVWVQASVQVNSYLFQSRGDFVLTFDENGYRVVAGCE